MNVPPMTDHSAAIERLRIVFDGAGRDARWNRAHSEELFRIVHAQQKRISDLAAAQDWRPMNTAPKDRAIVAWCVQQIDGSIDRRVAPVVARWKDGDWIWHGLRGQLTAWFVRPHHSFDCFHEAVSLEGKVLACDDCGVMLEDLTETGDEYRSTPLGAPLLRTAEAPQCNGKCRGLSSDRTTSEWAPDPDCPLHGV